MSSIGKAIANNLRLEIGQAVQLQHLGQSDEPRFNVELIGWSSGESIIVKPPLNSNWVLLLSTQSSYAARLFTGSSAFGFQTSILCTHHDPFDYLHLHYPEQVKSTRVRQSPRIKVDMEAFLKTAEEKLMGVKLLDLSQTGVGIFGPANLANTGDHLQVSFDIRSGDEDHPFSQDVIVRNIRNFNPDQSEWIYGLEFNNLGSEKVTILSRFLYEQMG